MLPIRLPSNQHSVLRKDAAADYPPFLPSARNGEQTGPAKGRSLNGKVKLGESVYMTALVTGVKRDAYLENRIFLRQYDPDDASGAERLELEITHKKSGGILRETLDVGNSSVKKTFSKSLKKRCHLLRPFCSLVAATPTDGALKNPESLQHTWEVGEGSIELYLINNQRYKQASEFAKKCFELQEVFNKKLNKFRIFQNPLEIAILKCLTSKVTKMYKKWDQDANDAKDKNLLIRIPGPNVSEIYIPDSYPHGTIQSLLDYKGIKQLNNKLAKLPKSSVAIDDSLIKYSDSLICRWIVGDKVITLNCRTENKEALARPWNSIALKFCNLMTKIEKLKKLPCGHRIEGKEGGVVASLLFGIGSLFGAEDTRERVVTQPENLALKTLYQRILSETARLCSAGYIKNSDLAQQFRNPTKKLEFRIASIEQPDHNIQTFAPSILDGRTVDQAIDFFKQCDPFVDDNSVLFVEPSCSVDGWSEPIDCSDKRFRYLERCDNAIWRLFDEFTCTASSILASPNCVKIMDAISEESAEIKDWYLRKLVVKIDNDDTLLFNRINSMEFKFTSAFKENLFLTENSWIVTLISYSEPLPGCSVGDSQGHAMLFYEGMKKGLPFRKYIHLTDSERIKAQTMEIHKSVSFRKMLGPYIVKSEQVELMEKECDGKTRPFDKLGPIKNFIGCRKPGSKGYVYNCLTFCITTMNRYFGSNLPYPTHPGPDRYIQEANERAAAGNSNR